MDGARAVAIALTAVAALVSCDRGRPAPPAPVVDDVTLVRQALDETRNKRTALFTVEGRLGVGIGAHTTRDRGSYDHGTGVAALTRTVDVSAERLVERVLGKKAGADPGPTSVVVTDSAFYVQRPAWPKAIRTRWLRLDASAPAADRRLFGFERPPEVLPPMLTLLEKATVSPKDRSFRSRVPPYAVVLVPAKDAFLAFPSTIVAGLLADGADADALTGDVEVTIEVDRGVVTMVTYDAIDVLNEVYEQLRRESSSFTEFRATLHVADHGEPVTLPEPSPREVMTRREYDDATG